jgi:head-tail adaptor
MAISGVLNTLVHPGLHASLTRAYPATVTIQRPTQTRATDFSIVDTWENVQTGIGGHLAAAALLTPQERRRIEMTGVNVTHILNLDRRLHVRQTDRAVVIRKGEATSQTFNIVSVDDDSQSAATRLYLEQVSW